MRFRCRVEHAYTAKSMLSGKSEALKASLWIALSTLKEGAQTSQKRAAESRACGHEHAAARFEERGSKTRKQANLIGQALDDGAADATEEAV